MDQTTMRGITITLNALALGSIVFMFLFTNTGRIEPEAVPLIMLFVLAPASALYSAFKYGQ